MTRRFKKYVSKRQRDIENEIKYGHYHTKDTWCGNCINFGQEVDLTSEGLGRGHVIGNAITINSENIREIMSNAFK